MNLKEAFHYQKFLDQLFTEAVSDFADQSHYFTSVQRHLKSAKNPNAEDITEIVEVEHTPTDVVHDFLMFLISEKQRLSEAITVAKAKADLDIDASIAVNKYRQMLVQYSRSVLRNTPKKTKSTGSDYVFNAEGNQTRYFYEIETEQADDFDRDRMRQVTKVLSGEAEDLSSKIDAAMVNANVEYDPAFSATESYADIIADFEGRSHNGEL